MAENGTGSKVALGVGIALALAGTGVALYFVLRKKPTEEEQARKILAGLKPPAGVPTFEQLKRQNPDLSNTELLKKLTEILKQANKKPQISTGSGSSSGGGGSQQQQKPKPQPQTQPQTGQYGQKLDSNAYADAVSKLQEGGFSYGSYQDAVKNLQEAGGFSYGVGSGSYGYAGGGSAGGYGYASGGGSYGYAGGGFGSYGGGSNYGYAGGGSGYGGYIS